MDYSSRFSIVGIFSTAEAEDMNSFLTLMNTKTNNTDYLYIHITPEAGDSCRKNVLSISFNIFIFFMFFFNFFLRSKYILIMEIWFTNIKVRNRNYKYIYRSKSKKFLFKSILQYRKFNRNCWWI